MLQSFIFGNSNDPTRPVSMDDLRRRQAVVDALAEKASDTSPVDHWSQGLNRVLLGVESGMKERAIGRDTKAGQDALAKAFGSLSGGIGGADQTAPAPSGPAPMPPDQIRAIIDANVPEADREYAYRMAQKESAFNPAAVSSTGATGLFQFTKGTGRDYGLVGQQGDARSDPALNTQAFVRFTNDNRTALRNALGREPTYGELAVAHQQGAGGAIALLTGKGTVDPRNLAVQAGSPKNAQDIMNYYGFGDGGGRAAVVGAMAGAPGPEQMAAAMQVMGSDFATPGQKAVAQAILERSMRDPMEGELRQLQIEKARRELQPEGPAFRTLTADEKAQMGLDPSKAYQVGRDGKIDAIGGGGVTVNTGGGDKFNDEAAKLQAKMFSDMATEGVNANSEISQIQQLRELVAATPGGLEGGLKSIAASYGLDVGPETTAIQAADALINKLVPAQRAPGSGPMSDRDVELYKSSLPSLWKTPEGNAILLDTMEALARYKAQQSEISTAVLNGQLTRQDGMKALRDLPDPLAAFKEWRKTQGKGGEGGEGGDGTPKKRLRFNPETGELE
jgi:hypothetical protein